MKGEDKCMEEISEYFIFLTLSNENFKNAYKEQCTKRDNKLKTILIIMNIVNSKSAKNAIALFNDHRQISEMEYDTLPTY